MILCVYPFEEVLHSIKLAIVISLGGPSVKQFDEKGSVGGGSSKATFDRSNSRSWKLGSQLFATSDENWAESITEREMVEFGISGPEAFVIATLLRTQRVYEARSWLGAYRFQRPSQGCQSSATLHSDQFVCSSEKLTSSSSRGTSSSAQPSDRNDTSSPREAQAANYAVSSVMSLTNITHAQPQQPRECIQYNPKKTRTAKAYDDMRDVGSEATTDNMDLLALGMIRLFLRYDTDSSSPPFSDSNSTSIRSTSDNSEFSGDRIKHEIITVLREAMPLGYLQDLCKRNSFPAVRWFPCTYPRCFNLYLSKGSQRRHSYSHTGERPYGCQFPGCDKSYSASDRLAEHMHSHTNQRPFRCTAPSCSKAYNDPKTLREHKRTHGDKTFICKVPGCNKSFHRKTHLKQHLRIHNCEGSAGPFVEVEKQEPSISCSPTYPQRSLLNNSTDAHFQVRCSANS
ncbi:hypothetical protein L0F63_006689 [Massospora cicadina]|nr:hypothetical protein L0F63_006689 [Massospora cicadina]